MIYFSKMIYSIFSASPFFILLDSILMLILRIEFRNAYGYKALKNIYQYCSPSIHLHLHFSFGLIKEDLHRKLGFSVILLIKQHQLA